MYYENITVDIAENNLPPVVYVKQGDTARGVKIDLTEHGATYTIPSPATYFINVRRKDGTCSMLEAELVDNALKADFSEKTTATAGRAIGEATICDTDGKVLSSFLFIIHIVECAIDPEKLEASDEYTGLGKILESLQDAENMANAAKATAEEGIEILNSYDAQAVELVAGLTNSLDQIEKNAADIQSNAAKVHNLTQVLLENKQMDFVTVEHAYTARQTADGEDIVDYNGEGQYTYPTKIQGDTVKCYSMIDFSGATSAGGLTVTTNNNTLTVKGTPTYDYVGLFSVTDITDLLEDGKTYNLYQSVAFAGADSSGAFFMQVNMAKADGSGNVYLNSSTGKISFVCNKTTYSSYKISIDTSTTANAGTINSTISFMFYEGTEEKPYQPYFTGLKNAYFEKIVSTGRNLIDFVAPFAGGNTSKELKLGAGTYTIQAICDDYDGIIINTIAIYFEDKYGSLSKSVNYTTDTSRVNAVNAFATFTITEDEALRICNYRVYMNATYGVDLVGKEIKIMLNYGTEALPYEPYTENVFALAEPVQLPKWDYISPQTGEVVRQTKRVFFDGTESWRLNNSSELSSQYTLELPLKAGNRTPISNMFNDMGADLNVAGACFITLDLRLFVVRTAKYLTLDEWKAHLAELYAAGTPLIVEYELAELTTEAIACPTNYLAKKDGMETIKQGNTDNSEYGAENAVTQGYIITIGGTGDE